MVRFQWLYLTCLCAVLIGFSGACGDEEHNGGPSSWRGICIDNDKDGYGFECEKGPDCDDTDPTLNTECGCARPYEGCACDENAEPVECVESREHTASGGMLCKTGMRYCQDGVWSACTSVRSFEVPSPAVVFSKLGIAAIDLDAAPLECLDPCRRDCYRVEDPLGEDEDVDAAVPGGQDVVYTPGGDITLWSYVDDQGSGGDPPPPTDIWVCDTVVDTDCNGIPDNLDEHHGKPKVAGEFPTIFMELGPGESGSRGFDVEFLVNSLDVYFLVDSTGSMGGSIKTILDTLTTGDYLGNYNKDCAAVIPEGQPNAGQPDNDLKKKGITGAIACKIRDAAFGAGWFREVPFDAHAYNWYPPFAHVQDIDTDAGKTLNAFKMFSPASNNRDTPEAGMVALQAVATGATQYMGWDRPGIPPRTCPDENQFGYPCFRANAVPVVMFITDDLQHGGPSSTAYNTMSGVTATPDSAYHPVPNTNEDFDTAYLVLGGAPVDTSFVTYTGDTRWMRADLHKGMLEGVSCPQWPSNSVGADEPGYPDAVFKFKVNDPNKTITISTKGSHHRPTLAVIRIPPSGVIVPPTSFGAPARTDVTYGPSPALIGPAANWPTEFNFQQAGAFNRDYPVAQLPRDAYGRCTDGASGYSGGSADPLSANNPREAFFRIQPTVDVKDATFRVSGDANPVIAVYNKLPALPEPPMAITGPSGANSNDYFGDFDLGAINGRYVRLIGGNTASSNITGHFPASGFKAIDPSCSAAQGTSPDAVIDFSVSGTESRRIRVETFRGLDGPDEVSSNAATFPHLVALIERPVTLAPTVVPVSGNDTVDTAWSVQASSIPTTEGAWVQFSGSLAGATANVSRENVYRPDDASTLTCSNVNSSDPDVIYRFQVNQQDAGSYDFDTVGSSGVTALSLHKDAVDTYRFVQSMVVEQVTATNNHLPSGQHLGTINGRSVQVVGGNTSNSNNKWSRRQIGGDTNSSTAGCRDERDDRPKELVYRFTVSAGSSIQTLIRFVPQYSGAISLFGPFDADASGPTADQPITPRVDCNNGRSGTTVEIQRSLAPGQYYLVVHASTDTGAGAFSLSVTHDPTYNSAIELGTVNDKVIVVQGDTRLFTKKWTSGNLGVANNANPPNNSNTAQRGCRDGTNSTNHRPPEAIYRFTVTGATGSTRTLKLALSNAFSDAVLGIYKAAPGGYTAGSNLGNGLYCQKSASASITKSFGPGDYYVVVHGASTTKVGAFTLTISDQNATSGGLLGCNQGLGARLRNQVLTAGTYYLVVKGAGTDYNLNIRRTPEIPPVIGCNSNGLGTNRGVLEADLQPGRNYSVIVRGISSNNQGEYGVILRDVSDAPAPLACANAAGYAAPQGTSSDSFTMDLKAGETYYVAVRSNGNISSTTDQPYMLSISNSRVEGWCDYESVNTDSAELVRKFPVGEYYAVIKGNSDIQTASGWTIPEEGRGRGWYQFTIGDSGLKKSNQSYKPPAWGNATSGVYKALVDNKIRVITVTASKAKDQGKKISEVTGAVNGTTPIWRQLNSDGSGLDARIVDAIAELTDNLAMDVSVEWIPLPDNPLDVPANQNRTFVFSAKAIPAAGGTNNGCDGIDSTQTRHLNCAPGARPRFEITFTNPSPDSIKPNPNDPEGGYRMQLGLRGNDQVIFARIPVYIIPKEDPTNGPVTRYAEWGSYTQDLRANGCFGTERPNWSSLNWTATLPKGTRIEWRVCTGETLAELDGCSYVLAAGVSTDPSANAPTCIDSSECDNGYCGASGGSEKHCHILSGPECQSDEECGTDGRCVSKQCVWNASTIALKPAIEGMNGKKLARLEARLFSNAERTKAPTLHTWGLEYTCQPAE